MAYTVKQVADLSGVSVRTLHFYDEADLLKPAYHGENGYRFYEEPQLLVLQQILFYRELGFELRHIKEVLSREDFERREALHAHRKVLDQKLARIQELIRTIDRTIQHVEGGQEMTAEEMFTGFRVAAGEDRFGERVTLGDDPNDCKVSAQDTGGAMAIFEFLGSGGGPPHRHHDQDEWIYVVEGTCHFEVGGERFSLTAGESIFLPRNTAHVWTCKLGEVARIINVYQPAGTMEAFFREVSRFEELPTRDEVLSQTYTEAQVEGLHRLFNAHGMDLLGPPLIVE
jgi:DNA-binding transcriptional MerR regulator